jgi:hypothetical protein
VLIDPLMADVQIVISLQTLRNLHCPATARAPGSIPFG